MISVEFSRTRAQATRNAQALIRAGGTPPGTGWLWSEKNVVQWDDDLAVTDQLIAAESAKHTQWRDAADLWENDLIEVQRITRAVARKGSFHFRANPVKKRKFDALHTDGENRADIFDQGLAARDAWEAADPAWVVETDLPLGSFSSLLVATQARQATHSAKLAAWRHAAAELMEKARAVDVDNVAWYAEATREFPAGTSEGDMIRSTVPTTSRPSEPVGQAVISNLMVVGGDIHFDVEAEHATRYTYLHQAPGSQVFLVEVADTPSSAFTLHNQAVGVHQFKVFGINSAGQGEESAVVEATVAQSAVA